LCIVKNSRLRLKRRKRDDELPLLNRAGGVFLFIVAIMLFELLPLWPATRLGWGALLWLGGILSALAWIHIEVIGMPDDEAPQTEQTLHAIPWAVVAIFLFFGQEFLWPSFMEASFRSLWNW